MGWRGTIRAIGAAQRRAERSSVRRQRELERQHKQYAKMLERDAAEYDVAVYQNLIEVLQSVHRDCGEAVNWHELGKLPEPTAPKEQQEHEQVASRALAQYKPGWFDKLLRRVEAQQAALTATLQKAKNVDRAAYDEATRKYNEDVAEWREDRALAERVNAGEVQAYLEVIQRMDPFKEIAGLGSSVEFRVRHDTPLEALVHVHPAETIPSEVKSLTQSGKLSTKKMPQGQFYDIYQDYVCGCALRVARELFALFPIRSVVVTAMSDMLDTGTGLVEERPILSLAIPRMTLERLNFDTLDPSDSLKNFVHQMSFKKSKGFSPVTGIDPLQVQISA